MANQNLSVAVLAASFFLACAGSAAAAQAPKSQSAGGNVPMVQDWTTSFVGFRNPMTPEQAKARGPAMYQRWQRLASDPRFMLSMQRKFEAQAAAADARSRRPAPGTPPPSSAARNTVVRDWKVRLGGNAKSAGFGSGDGEGTAGIYPAKFNFNINATPSCANDFIVYPTSTAGNTAVGADSSRVSTTWANASTAGTITLGLGGRQVILSGNPSFPNSGVQFTTTSSGTTNAANAAAAINRWTGTTGISATAASGVITATVKNSKSLVSIAVAFSGAVSFPLQSGASGTESQGMPSVLAYNQLYNVSCDPASGSPAADAARTHPLYPNVFWSYNTGGTVVTSPVLSYWDNAQQVAFIQTAGGQAQLVLLRWKAGEGTPGRPVAPTGIATLASDYHNGTGPCAGGVSCMYAINFAGAAANTLSSPFVDYFNDVLYVGAANGTLHKFTGVFHGDPAEVTTGGFPAAVSTVALGSPVYDFNGSVFVGSTGSATAGVGGALHKVNATNGNSTASAKLAANAANQGVRAAPMLDIAAGKVFAFVYQGAGAATSTCTTAPCREVWQFDTASFPGTPVRATIGGGNASARVQWGGAFDSAWYNSADSTGSIYVCGGGPGDLNDQTLWKLTLNSGVMGATALQGPQVSSNSAQQTCSPVTRVKNGANEYIYAAPNDLGVDGNQGLCTGNCFYMYNIADLRNYEDWTFDVSGNINAASGSLTVGSVILTPITTGTSTCTAAGGGFDVNGNPASDLASLLACLALVPGYTVSNVSGTTSFTLRANTQANLPDTSVVEVGDIPGFAQTGHRDGSASGTSWQPNSLPAAGLPMPSIGGSTGIIIDNLGATPGTSQIYFMTIASPGVSVQASQSGLQ